MDGLLPVVGMERFEVSVLRSERPTLVVFGAAYCPACRLMENAAAELAKLHPEIMVAYVDVAGPDAASLRERYLWPLGASFSVSLIPVTILFERGQPRETLYGATTVAQMEERLLPWLAGPARRGGRLTEGEVLALERLRSTTLPGRRLRPSALKDL